jgi:hypothetical protein
LNDLNLKNLSGLISLIIESTVEWLSPSIAIRSTPPKY